MLSMYVSEDHRDWDCTLPFVTFAYNSSRHDVTGYSPFYLLYGRDPLLPLDSLLPSEANSTTFYAHDAIARAATARRVARDRLLASQADQKRLYDSHHRDMRFSPGSLVLLWLPSRRVGLSEKLLPRYAGPYRVLRQVTEVTYEISPLTPKPSSPSPAAYVTSATQGGPFTCKLCEKLADVNVRLTGLEGHRDDAPRLKMEALEALVQELTVKLQQQLHRVDIPQTRHTT
ncbi:uncharacterized protein LOC119406741 [Rhipicephalus sanguineus]|uniref:uncharacterized protein LOC119406741 n=1 Tax=Rhipicephalus sanguineus TaxID=34632 RepID=UPI001895ED8D|nr:uncharacterized protein LOC119406741 [Rhipicephalus sanguineus]